MFIKLWGSKIFIQGVSHKNGNLVVRENKVKKKSKKNPNTN